MVRAFRAVMTLTALTAMCALPGYKDPEIKTDDVKKLEQKRLRLPRIPVGNSFGQLFYILNRGRHDRLTEPFVREMIPGSTRSEFGTEFFLDLSMWETLIVKFTCGVGVGPGLNIVRSLLGVGGKWHMCRTKTTMHATTGLGATLIQGVASVYLLIGGYWGDCTCLKAHNGQIVSLGINFLPPIKCIDGLVLDLRIVSRVSDNGRPIYDDSGRFSTQPTTGLLLSIGRVWSLQSSR
jgi:hypothetical protein